MKSIPFTTNRGKYENKQKRRKQKQMEASLAIRGAGVVGPDIHPVHLLGLDQLHEPRAAIARLCLRLHRFLVGSQKKQLESRCFLWALKKSPSHFILRVRE